MSFLGQHSIVLLGHTLINLNYWTHGVLGFFSINKESYNEQKWTINFVGIIITLE